MLDHNTPYSCFKIVVPLAGTWIETVKVGTYDEVTIKSFPLRERGLKRAQSIKGIG